MLRLAAANKQAVSPAAMQTQVQHEKFKQKIGSNNPCDTATIPRLAGPQAPVLHRHHDLPLLSSPQRHVPCARRLAAPHGEDFNSSAPASTAPWDPNQTVLAASGAVITTVGSYDPGAPLNCSDPCVLAAVKVFFRKSIMFLSYETSVSVPKQGVPFYCS
ncbi:hypothetical protein GUJ93_ZPchr0011g27289 [Zizania palustris]|uniref:Uncharacterized protein n=1 Tax=Zizania palustris TaxID=103762 RepID=A0A8J5WJY7_ZIZPA|nr:hypothetical protein GUJ93_ZPchr0011g27289 [Zizania palustris]